MRSNMEQSARLLRGDTRADLVIGKPVWEPGGRKIGTLKALSGPEPTGAQYAIVCLGSYPKVGAGGLGAGEGLQRADLASARLPDRLTDHEIRARVEPQQPCALPSALLRTASHESTSRCRLRLIPPGQFQFRRAVLFCGEEKIPLL